MRQDRVSAKVVSQAPGPKTEKNTDQEKRKPEFPESPTPRRCARVFSVRPGQRSLQSHRLAMSRTILPSRRCLNLRKGKKSRPVSQDFSGQRKLLKSETLIPSKTNSKGTGCTPRDETALPALSQKSPTGADIDRPKPASIPHIDSSRPRLTNW